MMNIHAANSQPSGIDTIVFTCTPGPIVSQAIIRQIKSEWPEGLVEVEVNGIVIQNFHPILGHSNIAISEEDHAVLTFAKSEMMANLFHERGYEALPNGEGAISFHLRKRCSILFEMQRLNELQSADRTQIGIRPYNAFLCSESVLETTAVTPGDPKSSTFSAWAVNVLIKSCLNG